MISGDIFSYPQRIIPEVAVFLAILFGWNVIARSETRRVTWLGYMSIRGREAEE